MLTLPSIPRSELAHVLHLLERGCATTSPDDVQVLVQGMPIRFPYRVYYAREDLRDACGVPGVTGRIALCLGTRHNDGYVREECMRALLLADEPWVVPFVLQLLGEYVLEIVTCIDSALSEQPPARYVSFAQENPLYMQRLGQQATSYWNEYYRRTYRRRDEYPALRLLGRLSRLSG
ncbi:hypothetical protein [uncultured Stenotrophomonas sp.]|jgi:hypothetical protein|uniref:hypothetical protein n=1 Tax=uncultured Stenotrophomonas sp. TaxID=165438 RepID=UPI0028D50B46|nr:hypothetical protein [uncultured Stenotrophomonas sp.]